MHVLHGKYIPRPRAIVTIAHKHDPYKYALRILYTTVQTMRLPIQINEYVIYAAAV